MRQLWRSSHSTEPKYILLQVSSRPLLDFCLVSYKETVPWQKFIRRQKTAKHQIPSYITGRRHIYQGGQSLIIFAVKSYLLLVSWSWLGCYPYQIEGNLCCDAMGIFGKVSDLGCLSRSSFYFYCFLTYSHPSSSLHCFHVFWGLDVWKNPTKKKGIYIYQFNKQAPPGHGSDWMPS